MLAQQQAEEREEAAAHCVAYLADALAVACSYCSLIRDVIHNMYQEWDELGLRKDSAGDLIS